MLRKVAPALTAFSMVTALACAAQAEVKFYTNVNEGAPLLDNLESESEARGTGLEEASFPGFLLSGAAGMDLGGLRLEGELLYNRRDGLSGQKEAAPVEGGSDVSTISGVANALVDLHTGGGLKPYFGGGVGYGEATGHGSRFRDVNLAPQGNGGLIYQVRAGVNYSVMPLSNINLGYRYMVADEFDGGVGHGSIDSGKLKAHVVELGVQIKF